MKDCEIRMMMMMMMIMMMMMSVDDIFAARDAYVKVARTRLPSVGFPS